jgi:hypothetical protein
MARLATRAAACALALIGGLAPATARAEERYWTAVETQGCHDGEGSDDVPRAAAQASLERGAAAEKAGKTREALAAYRDGACADPPRARAAIRRIGRPLGAAKEAKGDLVGAFEAYDSTMNWADADRVLLQHARAAARASDFSKAQSHFEQQAKYFQDPEYAPNPATREELREIAERRAGEALAREAKAFAPQARPGMPAPWAMSLQELEEAKDWLAFYTRDDPRPARRAEERGDALAGDTSSPEALEAAKKYYAFADRDAKVKQVEANARRLGEAALAAKADRKAARYLDVAGDSGRATQIEKQLEARGEAAVKNIEKTDEERKKFQAEQDALERELGLE